MNGRADAVVVGAGPNGLAAALRLAAAGLRVQVVEAGDKPGGGMRTEELIRPGFHHDVCSTVQPMAVAAAFFREFDPESRGVRFVRLWFTDVLGFLKSVEITPAELEVALEEGMTFDGSTIEGYSRIQESDMLARPDANTFELLASSGDGDAAVARMFCDIEMFSGEPFDGDPELAPLG